MNIPENFDRWMFDYTEGNLSSNETKAFEQFLLKNPSFEADADAWRNASIIATPVSYPNQNKLQRNHKFGAWYGWSAAAAVVLLLGIVALFSTSKNKEALSLVQTKFSKSQFNQLSNTLSNRDTDLNRTSFIMDANNSGENDELATTNTSANQTDLNNPGLLTASISQPLNLLVDNNKLSTIEGGDEFFNAVNAAENSNNFRGEDTFELTMFTVLEGQDLGVDNKSLTQETNKFDENAYASQYENNPVLSEVDLDLSKKNNVKVNSLASRTKKLYRKVEKKFGYPVGLVNLRDPDMVLPENNVTEFNPGFTGGMFKQRFEMNYRNQWYNSELNSQKARLSYDTYVPGLRGGIGFAIKSNVYGNGALTDNAISLTYSPKIILSKNVVFEPGVKVEVGMMTGNTAKFKGAQAFELERGLPQLNNFTSEIYRTDKLIYKDYGFGFVLNTKRFYLGLSADNLGNHFGTVYRLEGHAEPNRTPTLITGIVGADYESANRNSSLSPYISIRKFGDQQEAWAGMNFKMGGFIIGGAYATNNNWTIATGMKFKKFKLVYQYDRTTTTLTQEQIGSHNIGIRFTGEPKNIRYKK